MDIIDLEIKRNNYSNYDDFFLTKIAANWPQIIINDFKEITKIYYSDFFHTISRICESPSLGGARGMSISIFSLFHVPR